MHDPFDLNHDGKLDDYERSVRDHHMLEDDFDIYNITRKPSSSGYSSRPGKNYSPSTSSATDSAQDCFLIAIGIAFFGAIGALLCYIFRNSEKLFGLFLLATFICGIGVIVYFIKGLIRLFRKNKVAGFILLGIALTALTVGVVKYVQWRFRNSSPTVADSKKTVTEEKAKYADIDSTASTTKAQNGTEADADTQAGNQADADAAGSGKSKSSGSSSGSKTKKQIDPDDLDVDGYYEDYKDDFEDVDDAEDDLLDNPDLWEDYD